MFKLLRYSFKNLQKVVVVVSKIFRNIYIYIISRDTNSYIFIMKFIIVIYLFTYINFIDNGVILLEGGDENKGAMIPYNNSRSPSPSHFHNMNNGYLSDLNNQLISNPDLDNPDSDNPSSYNSSSNNPSSNNQTSSNLNNQLISSPSSDRQASTSLISQELSRSNRDNF